MIMPVSLLFFFRESELMRSLNFVVQCLILVFLIIALLVGLLFIGAIVTLICGEGIFETEEFDFGPHAGQFDLSFGDNAFCEHSQGFFYGVYFALSLILISIQVIWVRIFGAYKDELKFKQQDAQFRYQRVPQHAI